MYKHLVNILIIGGLLLAFPIVGKANSDGQLDINNEIIYNDNQQVKHKNNSGFTIDNQLFLDDITKMEKKKEKNSQEKLTQIYKKNFITPMKKEKSVTAEANKYLFRDYQAVEIIPHKNNSHNDNQKFIYLKYMGITIGGIMMTLLGIKIGKQFTLYQRKKEEIKYGK